MGRYWHFVTGRFRPIAVIQGIQQVIVSRLN